MKRLIFIASFFFIISCSTGTQLTQKNIIKPGMTKLDVNWALYTKAFMDQILIPTSYREYFAKEKKEILASDKKIKDIYYVFRNVNRPVTCGWILCKEGDGILDKTFSNYSDAANYVSGEKKEPKKTLTIVENDKTEEISFATDENKESIVSDLSKLIEDYKAGKISKEEFDKQKTTNITMNNLLKYIFFIFLLFQFSTNISAETKWITKKKSTNKLEIEKIEAMYADGYLSKSECVKAKSKLLKLPSISKTICDNVDIKSSKERKEKQIRIKNG